MAISQQALTQVLNYHFMCYTCHLSYFRASKSRPSDSSRSCGSASLSTSARLCTFLFLAACLSLSTFVHPSSIVFCRCSSAGSSLLLLRQTTGRSTRCIARVPLAKCRSALTTSPYSFFFSCQGHRLAISARISGVHIPVHNV